MKLKTLHRSLPTLIATALLFLAGIASAQANPKPTQGPVEVITETTGEITKVLENRELPELSRQNKVIDVVDKRVHFETVCKLVLARNYKKFSKDQRKDFIREFRRHLLFTYWNNATTFEFDTGAAQAFHTGVGNEIEGIGLPMFDSSAHYGGIRRAPRTLCFTDTRHRHRYDGSKRDHQPFHKVLSSRFVFRGRQINEVAGCCRTVTSFNYRRDFGGQIARYFGTQRALR